MNIQSYVAQIRRLDPDSHKGQNGKVLLIGGSELFHAASRWSLDVLASMVDMVFYSSVPENNDLIVEAKKEFWDGVVVPRDEVENYIEEADVVLIGPGMTRDKTTQTLTNKLLTSYPDKKWVIDAGALQMIKPHLLNKHCIITPHLKELETVCANCEENRERRAFDQIDEEVCRSMSAQLGNVTILLKGKHDVVSDGTRSETVAGGNAGMTKGGTGDVLAGLVAGLYAFTEDPFVAAVVGSYVNKTAGDRLYQNVGPFFKTSQLVEEIPLVLKELLYSFE